jgi:hypothetical protein
VKRHKQLFDRIVSLGNLLAASRNALRGTGAFLWTSGGGMQGITTLLDSSGDGWFIEEVYGINNAGQIAATGRVVGDRFRTHALLLTPIPEPSTLAMGSCGLVLVAVVGLRRGRQRRDKSTGDGSGI